MKNIISSTNYFKGTSKISQLINNKLEELTAEDIAVGDDVVNIRDYAFRGLTNLKKVTLPQQTTSIGSNAFYGCSNLEEINFPNSLTSIGVNAFYGSGIRSFKTPKNTTVGDNVCNSCINLEYVYFSEGIKFQTYNALYGCPNLKEVYFEEGFVSAEPPLFDSVSKVFRLILPSTTKGIGQMIMKVSSITNLICKAKIPPTISSTNGLTTITRVFVPTNSITADNGYQKATNWSTIASKFYPLVNTYEDLSSVTNYTYACVKGNEEYIIYQFIDGQWYEVT